MAGEVTLTIAGNATSDAELRFTPSGDAVATFTVAATPRTFRDGEWRDGDPLFLRCSVWRQQAENVAESVMKGTRLVVTGRLKQRSYETREGEKRTVVELDADEVAVSLKFAQAQVQRATRGEPSRRPARGGEDPWASAAPAPAGSAYGVAEGPPF